MIKPRESDHVGVLPFGRVEDRLGGRHHPEVDDAVVVAAEDHADDVLADVVDVALHGRGHDRALRGADQPQPLLLLLHERLEVGDRLLHRSGGLHDLREEHLPGAEEVADDLHPVHQRPLDHLERPFEVLPRLLRVLLDERVDAVDECVREPLLDGAFPPRQVLLGPHRLARDGLREGEHPLGRIRTPVEDQVLDVLLEVLRDVVVDRELARVHDRHVEPGLARVVQERRMHRLADDVVPAEGEREIRDASGDLHAGQTPLDDPGRIDERPGIVRVLLHPGGDREDVGVEDDVRRVVARLLGEQPVGALADLDLALDGVGLPLLVEGHHDDGGAVALHAPGLREEILLALLQADRVHDALALDALQPGLDHVPAG